jgi:hypothetical protein
MHVYKQQITFTLQECTSGGEASLCGVGTDISMQVPVKMVSVQALTF